jgi:hypothetical protein
MGSDGDVYLYIGADSNDVVYFSYIFSLSPNIGPEYSNSILDFGLEYQAVQVMPDDAVLDAFGIPRDDIDLDWFTNLNGSNGVTFDHPLGMPGTVPPYDLSGYDSVVMPGYALDDMLGTVENLSDEPAMVKIGIEAEAIIRSDANGDPLDPQDYYTIRPADSLVHLDFTSPGYLLNGEFDVNDRWTPNYWENADTHDWIIDAGGFVYAKMSGNDVLYFPYSFTIDKNATNMYANAEINLIITAEWEIMEYSVVFMSDGAVFDSQTVEHGQAANDPGIPTKDGYIFDGWDEDFSCITGDLIVTALWKEDLGPPYLRIDSPSMVQMARYSSQQFSVIIGGSVLLENVEWAISPANMAVVDPATGLVSTLNVMGVATLIATDTVSGIVSVIVIRIS